MNRFVHTSSIMVTWGYTPGDARDPGRPLIAGDAPPRPVGTYAVTKMLGESLCRHGGPVDRLPADRQADRAGRS